MIKSNPKKKIERTKERKNRAKDEMKLNIVYEYEYDAVCVFSFADSYEIRCFLAKIIITTCMGVN